MSLRDIPIQRKLMRAILITSGSVLLLTCSTYFAYEFFTFRQANVRQLSILGEIIAANSTAALAFDSREDADEILAALKAEPHIVAAVLFDQQGNPFSHYPKDLPATAYPETLEDNGYRISRSHLVGFQSIVQGNNRLGTLYLTSDLGAMYKQFRLYGVTALMVIILSFILAYLLSKKMRRGITEPILALADIAKAISNRKDYSVRAIKLGNDEIGQLTDAFNHMLTQIQAQNQEIKLFNQKLEQKIVERTNELEFANKELESFSYSVSHDLRAPLRSIDGYSQVLIEDYHDKLDDDGKHTLNIIMRNATRMGQLIDDLLAFSRAGKQNLTKVTMDMHSITINIIEELKAQQPKEVEIKIKNMLKAHGDSSMLKQVMTNLISNALKYSIKKEKPSIEIGSYREDHCNVYYVKDNGAGFDMRYYDKLFGVFQRLHSNEEFEGTGVGLALTKRIIKKHGGEVWAEGKVNDGATFYFSLPISDVVNGNSN